VGVLIVLLRTTAIPMRSQNRVNDFLPEVGTNVRFRQNIEYSLWPKMLSIRILGESADNLARTSTSPSNPFYE
jgi:hypothetical protein